MSYLIKSIGGSENIPLKEYVIDTKEELESLNLDEFDFGTKFVVLDGGSSYILNSRKELKEVATGGAGGAGGAGDAGGGNASASASVILRITEEYAGFGSYASYLSVNGEDFGEIIAYKGNNYELSSEELLERLLSIVRDSDSDDVRLVIDPHTGNKKVFTSWYVDYSQLTFINYVSADPDRSFLNNYVFYFPTEE